MSPLGSNNKCRADKSRHGHTLIELMVTMSIGAVVLTVAAGWIHQSMKTASIMRDRERQNQSLLRLSNSLRSTVNRGESIVMDGDQTLLIEFARGQQVTFRIQNEAVQMQETRNGKLTRQDAFRLTDRCKAEWDASEMPNWITLVVQRQPQAIVQRVDDAKQTELRRPVELIVRTAPGRRIQLGTAELVQ